MSSAAAIAAGRFHTAAAGAASSSARSSSNQNANTQNVITTAADCAGMPNSDATKKPIKMPRSRPTDRRSAAGPGRANIIMPNTTHHHSAGMLPSRPSSAIMWRSQLCALSGTML